MRHGSGDGAGSGERAGGEEDDGNEERLVIKKFPMLHEREAV